MTASSVGCAPQRVSVDVARGAGNDARRQEWPRPAQAMEVPAVAELLRRGVAWTAGAAVVPTDTNPKR